MEDVTEQLANIRETVPTTSIVWPPPPPPPSSPKTSVRSLVKHTTSRVVKHTALGPCAICLQPLAPSQLARGFTRCAHDFHMECLEQWLTNHTTCPICRFDIHSKA